MSKEILYTRDLDKKEVIFCKATLDDITPKIDTDHDRMYFAIKRDVAINGALKDVIDAKLANPATSGSFASEPIPFAVTIITLKPEKNQPILCKDGNAEDPRYNAKTGAVDISLADKHYTRTVLEGIVHIKVSPLINGLLELIDMKWEIDESAPSWLNRPEEIDAWPARFTKDKDEDDADDEEIDESQDDSDDDCVDELD